MPEQPDEESVETDVKVEDLTFPTSEISRNRPRGSGVGKSIHKAAEASNNSTIPRSAISKSQVSNQGQQATPRISASHLTVKDLSFSSPQLNFARKTIRRRSGETDSLVHKPRRSLATRPAMKRGYYRSEQLSDSDNESERSKHSVTSSSTSLSLSSSCSSQLSYVIPASDTVVETPPAPLVKAYEELLAKCLFLQHKRKLPFLLRNLKKAFRVRCKEAGEKWPSNHISVSYGEEKEKIFVLYRYTDPQGVQYTFQSPHFVRECPLCSLMGILPSWSTLAKHLSWSHHEIEFQIVQSPDIMQPKIKISLDEDKRFGFNDNEAEVQALNSEHSENVTSPTRSPTHLSDLEVETEMENEGLSKEKIDPAPPLSSQPSALFQAFDNSHYGPADPVTTTGPKKTVSYRPDGPHLYDHLSSLTLDEFGPLTWFVLDKEEETFELTDVLDEDKVMCALWGRWIIFNRPMFISDYKAGAEKFLDQYWTMIYKAAGWASWRAFLLTLVSHKFLTNKEMVHLLKRYNELAKGNKRKMIDHV